MRYRIEFADEALQELEALRPYDANRILDAVEENLRYEPTRVSRNRKPVVPTDVLLDVGITWELRVGAFRVFYDIEDDGVLVIRIVRKEGSTTEESLK